MTTGNVIFIFKGSQMVKLHKGMSMNNVRTLLGNDHAVESCADKNDQKWVYNFSGTNGTYKLLFRNENLEWAMKGTYFVKKTIDEKLVDSTKKKKKK